GGRAAMNRSLVGQHRSPVEDLDHLRADTLRLIAAAALVVGYLLLFAEVVWLGMLEARLRALSLGTMTRSVVAWLLAGRAPRAAALLVVGGLCASSAIAVGVYGARQVVFALPLIVFVVPVVAGLRWTIATLLGVAVLVRLLLEAPGAALAPEDAT